MNSEGKSKVNCPTINKNQKQTHKKRIKADY